MNSLTRIYTESVLSELQVGKDTYYADIKFLGIKTQKDADRKAFITQEDLDLFLALRSHVANHGTRQGFKNPESGELIVRENNQTGLTQKEKRI